MDTKVTNVLLIEDNPGDARLIQEMLAEAQYASFNLQCVNQLSTGLERLADGGIDLVLLDLSLPDQYGLDTFTRTHTQAPNVPIILLTGLHDEALASKALQEGAQDYLIKGQIDSSLLVRSMRYAVERKRAEYTLFQAQKMESLGVLAGGVAHDFNNLLAAILGQVSLAQTKLPADSPAHANIGKAVKAAERAADLARQMLAYSGRGQFESRPMDLNTLIQENLHLFEVAVSKNVQLHSALADTLPLIEADHGQMQQVVMNLILNAAEAIEERAGTVTVVTSTQEIHADSEPHRQHIGDPLPPGCYVALEVRDDGCGMDTDTLSRIFDPFFTTKFTGRGLGLAAVLGIVRGHRGGLYVNSQIDKGTTFKLLFPASDAAPKGPTTVDAETNPVRGVILVIDDEEPVREVITDILESEGLQTINATHGAAGIALYREKMADISLVLLDWSMPGMSGEETFSELQKINPDVRVLLSSGYAQEDATRRFEGKGLVGFVHKPYSTRKLVNMIRQHLPAEKQTVS